MAELNIDMTEALRAAVERMGVLADSLAGCAVAAEKIAMELAKLSSDVLTNMPEKEREAALTRVAEGGHLFE